MADENGEIVSDYESIPAVGCLDQIDDWMKKYRPTQRLLRTEGACFFYGEAPANVPKDLARATLGVAQNIAKRVADGLGSGAFFDRNDAYLDLQGVIGMIETVLDGVPNTTQMLKDSSDSISRAQDLIALDSPDLNAAMLELNAASGLLETILDGQQSLRKPQGSPSEAPEGSIQRIEATRDQGELQ